MPRFITRPEVIPAAGEPPKVIEEFVGRASTGHETISIARMQSPSGWREPGQRPTFVEITIVTRGMLRVEHEGGSMDVHAGQAMIASPGEWVRYSSPGPAGAEYVAVCLPAFSTDAANRGEP
jgi:mannose-6-phosphate isomerase-like protein (cupin superfamily)